MKQVAKCIDGGWTAAVATLYTVTIFAEKTLKTNTLGGRHRKQTKQTKPTTLTASTPHTTNKHTNCRKHKICSKRRKHKKHSQTRTIQ